MFERFTDRARRVVVLAQEEARLLNHNYIGTEHILLGLIHEGDGVAARAVESLSISLADVRAQVEEIIRHGAAVPSGHIPFTPRAKTVLELSLREARQLGHNYIGTEHILLGLIREGEGVAAQVLVRLGADLGRVRRVVIRLISDAPDVEEAPDAFLGAEFPDPAFSGPEFMGLSQTAVFAAQSVVGLTPATCSFCAVPSPACGALFAGQGGALICEQCVRRGASGLADSSDQRTLRVVRSRAPFGPPPGFGPPEPPPIEVLAARHEPTGPPPADEEAARAEIDHVFTNMRERTADGGLVNVEHGESLGRYLDEVQARRGGITEQASQVVEHVLFLNATDAVVWMTTLLNGHPIAALRRRECRAVVVDGGWKASYETMRGLLAFAGAHAPPWSDDPSSGSQ